LQFDSTGGGSFLRAMSNPYLRDDFRIRWPELTANHVVPAVNAALGRAESALAAITAVDLAAVTFENTFLALERVTEELNLVWSKVGHQQSVADEPALRAAHSEVLPRVTAFFARIPLKPDLWARLRAFAATPAAAALSGVQRRFLEETVKDFRDAGADLPANARARLEALQTEMAQVAQKFGENVLDATNAWQLVIPPAEEARLEGLPSQAKAAARRSAEAKGVEGWRFTLHQPSLEPVLMHLRDEDIRRQVWSASAAIGSHTPHDNAPQIERLLQLRAEKAKLLGQDHFADSVLRRRMAGQGARALAFVEDFRNRCLAPFAREAKELEEFRAAGTGEPVRRLAPWDVAFWAERLRQASYQLDEEALRPYLPMDRVIAGLFEIAGRVFGLKVTEHAPGTVPVWHPEVRFYEMHDRAGRHVGSFYADWHPRESKRGGAWMNYLITGGPQPDGTRLPHLGLICGNMTPPAGDRPALLTHREVETIFHEFGHLLHHLLGEVPIKSLNGVNVAWDFVELPSQILENWTWEREGLDLFARHHETGAPIPEELFGRMQAARNFRAASATMRQVAFGKLDLLLHMHTADYAGAGDVEPRLRAAVADCLVPTEPPAPTIVKRFTHLFGDPVGYAAGYYSYKWAEVLEADAFTRFQREGIFSREVGAEFVRCILSRGNAEDPAVLFRSFLGRDPDPQALLRRCGLAA